MKLPHAEPLIYAKDVLNLDDTKAVVSCEFDQKPTIGMFIEAAAQSSAAFFQEGDAKLGFLAQANDIELIDFSDELNYTVELNLQIKFESMSKFDFIIKLKEDKVSVCKGKITVSLQKENEVV